MPTFISTPQASRLRKAVRSFRDQVTLGAPWNKLREDDLWRKVLCQIVVVGRAQPGYRLQHDRKIGSWVSIRRLSKFRNEAALRKHLHKVFVEIGTRYVGTNWQSDRKAAAGAKNFRILMKAGGPKKFFEQVAKCKTEASRIDTLQNSLKFYGDKGSRDTLIELGLAENCMALDVRILGILEAVGVRARPNDIYRQIEKELCKKVAEPLGFSPALLDRILFQNYDGIMVQLRRC